MNNYRTVDLFCGGGGLSQGLLDAGFNIVAAFDFWDPALKMYNQNITSHSAYKLDLSKEEEAIQTISMYQPDIIVGGPPCQDFSSAGKRDENGGRADLTISYAKIVTAVKPQIFIMENVDRALKAQTYQTAIEQMKVAGYHIVLSVLDASLCGVPQKRKRAVAVGMLNENPEGLIDIYKSMQRSHPMTMREYFGEKLKIDYYYRHPRSYARRGIFGMDEPSPTVRGVNRPIPKGYPGHPGDPVPPETPGLRPLTTKERSLVQTFPESWKLVGSKSDIEQIIGNAVPVKLGTFVGNAIAKFLNRDNMQKYILADVTEAQGTLMLFEQHAEYGAKNHHALQGEEE